jgi:hypothetical protein
MSRPFPALFAFFVCAALCAALSACSGATKPKPAPSAPDYLEKIDAYVERGRYAAALALIGERINQEPANYEHYLLRATIFTAMHDDARALADLDAALTVFDKHKRAFTPKEQAVRLAGIHKDYALASYLAERRAAADEAARYRELFDSHAALAKSLDEPTYARLMAMIGRAPEASSEPEPKNGPISTEAK